MAEDTKLLRATVNERRFSYVHFTIHAVLAAFPATTNLSDKDLDKIARAAFHAPMNDLESKVRAALDTPATQGLLEGELDAVVGTAMRARRSSMTEVHGTKSHLR